MPVCLKLTDTATAENPVVGDLYLRNGSYVVIGDTAATFPEAVAQTYRNSVAFFKGEWFLDTREGTPYHEQILVENPDISLIREIFKSILGLTEGVASVERMELTRLPDRLLDVQYAAQLVDGQTLDSRDFTPLIVRY